jgi:hypothetical protein
LARRYEITFVTLPSWKLVQVFICFHFHCFWQLRWKEYAINPFHVMSAKGHCKTLPYLQPGSYHFWFRDNGATRVQCTATTARTTTSTYVLLILLLRTTRLLQCFAHSFRDSSVNSNISNNKIISYLLFSWFSIIYKYKNKKMDKTNQRDLNDLKLKHSGELRFCWFFTYSKESHYMYYPTMTFLHIVLITYFAVLLTLYFSYIQAFKVMPMV